MINVILCSNSNIKHDALKKWLSYYFENEIFKITKLCPEKNEHIVPEQPIGIGGLSCCKNRLDYIEKKFESEVKENKYIISIENSLTVNDDTLLDVVNVVLKNIETGVVFKESGEGIAIKTTILDKYPKFINIINDLVDSYKKTNKTYIFNGCQKTLGTIINKYYPNIPKNNWMKYIYNKDRKEQIYDVLTNIGDLMDDNSSDEEQIVID